MAAYSQSETKLFMSEKYSDFAITCNGRRFPIHRAVVCSQSRFFQKMTDIGFKVSNPARWSNRELACNT
ncbi:hypothetical protein BJ170DRAFT_606570 [Xylariales sp. AK1849]|nr:hypothetical protein BJ170DRAFT_606570 [Xylariales sp. AK1849]